jgi:hypothetical protein
LLVLLVVGVASDVGQCCWLVSLFKSLVDLVRQVFFSHIQPEYLGLVRFFLNCYFRLAYAVGLVNKLVEDGLARSVNEPSETQYSHLNVYLTPLNTYPCCMHFPCCCVLRAACCVLHVVCHVLCAVPCGVQYVLCVVYCVFVCCVFYCCAWT